jgi:hypothetical protein
MLDDLWKRQRLLVIAGSVSFVCALILAMVLLFDSTQVLGINRWVKPIKFFISIALFLITIAVYFNQQNGYEKAKRFIAKAMIAIFSVEMFIIVMQAARGTISHYNVLTPLDGALFTIMGVAIAINTGLVAFLLFLFFKAKSTMPKVRLWGMRLGIIVFLCGSIEGGYMAAQTGHTVGFPDGGDGLFFVNWSTQGGDLRVAHFVGLHAIQIIPAGALILERLQFRFQTILLFIFAAFYLGMISFLFMQALRGQPLFFR